MCRKTVPARGPGLLLVKRAEPRPHAWVLMLLVASICMSGCESGRNGRSNGGRSSSTAQRVVIQRVAAQTQVDESELHPGIRLKDDLKMDDLDLVELTMDLEDHCGISIRDDEATRWRTIADIVATVGVKLAPRTGVSDSP